MDKIKSYCIKEVDFIGIPPKSVISSYDEVLTLIDSFDHRREESRKVYAMYEPTERLQEWANSQFDYPVVASYQLLLKDLPFHSDRGGEDQDGNPATIRWNYLLTTGGARTLWRDENEEILCDFACQAGIWYQLDIVTQHCVVGVTSPRLSISIRPA